MVPVLILDSHATMVKGLERWGPNRKTISEASAVQKAPNAVICSSRAVTNTGKLGAGITRMIVERTRGLFYTIGGFSFRALIL